MMLFLIMMKICVWMRVFIVVVSGVKVRPEICCDIQKIQLVLELKYRRLKKRLDNLFYLILFDFGNKL